ncbi:hypothetical protein C7S18_15375 [Ahniella affigens]|uniref:HTH tetR-type domain-containing protein n=1 Tax=Ahniella affigens TaxID=2021234 RepID=A0A2P1PUH0_9GAMM|nr:TetR/AcrR family transcriptional regulator [Ahniella affigens]AVP98481.1 hypothetical protein C7S18_15375 [Ahniella affigens]
MARTQKFQSEQMLEATRALAVQLGPAEVTIAKIAATLGAPTGSIYHRFSSRDELLGQVWLNAAARYQADYHQVLSQGDPIDAAIASVRFVLSRARIDPDESRLLMLHRREDFLDQAWPKPMQDAGRALEADARRQFLDFGKRLLLLGASDATAMAGLRYALIDVPLAAIVPALRRGKTPDATQDHWVLAATRAVLAELGVTAGRTHPSANAAARTAGSKRAPATSARNKN